MKKYRWPLLLLFCLGSVLSCVKEEKSVFTKSFEAMLCSDDVPARMTAIILAADIDCAEIQQVLKERLHDTNNIERTAIMYSLYRHDNGLEHEFIDSIPSDENGILELLLVDSPLGSFFRSPCLRVIAAVGDIAMYDDAAFEKLKRIFVFSDGWQGDYILEMIIDSERKRGGDVDLLIESLLK